MKLNKSKFVPKAGFPKLPAIEGIRLSAIDAQISSHKKPDLLLVEACKNSAICGLFTNSKTFSAAVGWSRKNIENPQNANKPIGIVVNSGNANVFTGLIGETLVKKVAQSLERYLNTSPENIFMASTGVIGEVLNYNKITSQIQKLVVKLKSDSFAAAAEAIMTTDTYPKGVHNKFLLGDISVKINGIAKGSGMIAPNMATMLVFIFSDIAIEKNILQKLVKQANKKTFNSITVDSDTSTSDSLFVVATGKAKMSKIHSINDPKAIKFQKYLSKIMLDLSHLVIKDGEGISKFIKIAIKGAKSYKSAFKVGKSIADSPLVKTAFAGEDPNWGRIVMAIGKAGIEVDKEKISIFFGPHIVAENGSISKNYDELNVSKYMKDDSLIVTVNLGIGRSEASIYTCDLTHDYISINADYRS